MKPYRKPTQVGEASSLRRTSDSSLRNSAKQLGVTSGDTLPDLVLRTRKFEILISKLETNPNVQIFKCSKRKPLFWSFGFWSFGHYFEFRISCFGFSRAEREVGRGASLIR